REGTGVLACLAVQDDPAAHHPSGRASQQLAVFSWSIAAEQRIEATMRRHLHLLLAVVLGSCFGCKGAPNKVEFVIPNGFRGKFALVPDESIGIEFQRVNGRFVVTIPPSGVIRFKGYFPFSS